MSIATVEPGQRYVLGADERNPFEQFVVSVVVLEIKSGWVRYRYDSNKTESSLECGWFLRFYKRLEA